MRTLFAAFFAVMRALPEGVSVALGLALGWLLEHVVRHRRRVVAAQLNLVYGATRTPAELRALRHEFYQHLGLMVMEMARLPGSDAAQRRARHSLVHSEHLDAARAAGRGTLVVTGHIGNWELGAITMAAYGYPMRALGKAMKSRPGAIILKMMRDDNGVPTLPVRQSMKDVLKALKANDVIAVLIDQNMTSDEGEFVPFFGHLACTLSTVAVLAARTGATIVPAHACRHADRRRHAVHFFPPFVLETPHAEVNANTRHNTARLTARIEEMINSAPAQWLWQHKRWKTRPPDEVTPPIRY